MGDYLKLAAGGLLDTPLQSDLTVFGYCFVVSHVISLLVDARGAALGRTRRGGAAVRVVGGAAVSEACRVAVGSVCVLALLAKGPVWGWAA